MVWYKMLVVVTFAQRWPFIVDTVPCLLVDVKLGSCRPFCPVTTFFRIFLKEEPEPTTQLAHQDCSSPPVSGETHPQQLCSMHCVVSKHDPLPRKMERGQTRSPGSEGLESPGLVSRATRLRLPTISVVWIARLVKQYD
jgi:hypothetical protein